MSANLQPWADAPGIGTDHRRVLVVEDSAVARAVIGRLIDASDRWAVVRAVATIGAALTYLATASVEVILLDVHLPDRDGLGAIPDLRAIAPGASIVVVSSSKRAAVDALALGATAAVDKAGPSSFPSSFGAALLDALARLPDIAPATPAVREAPRLRPAPPPTVAAASAPRRTAADFDLVAIGASTGGIHALSGVLGALPIACRVPIVVTQHLPASFMPFFADQLALVARRPCEVAVDRLRLVPGRIVVAPGDAHLQAVALGDGGTAVRLIRDPQPSGCLPSVDPMLASLAAIHRDRLLAVVLSGMGRDGALGAAAVRRAGGTVIVQDCDSSVVWGMPGAIAAEDAAVTILPPAAIGHVIASGRRPE